MNENTSNDHWKQMTLKQMVELKTQAAIIVAMEEQIDNLYEMIKSIKIKVSYDKLAKEQP